MVIFHSYVSLPEGSLKGPILRNPILRKPNLGPGFVALEISTSEEVAQIVVGLEAFELSFHPGGDALRSLGARPRSGQKLARCEPQQRSCQGELLWIIIDPDDGNTLEWCGSFNPVFNLTERSEKNIQIILRKIPQNSSPVKSSTSKREVSSKSAIFDAGRMGPSWTSRITGF